ncbi:MAG: hypothetical protein F6K65_22250 [Moorea sp. SIO3C2]|nr:hypothetical protein [Moorena sp. SIO3C2]
MTSHYHDTFIYGQRYGFLIIEQNDFLFMNSVEFCTERNVFTISMNRELSTTLTPLYSEMKEGWWAYEGLLSRTAKNYTATEYDILDARAELATLSSLSVSYLGRCGANVCLTGYSLHDIESEFDITMQLLGELISSDNNLLQAIAGLHDELRTIRLSCDRFQATKFQ